MAAAAAEPDLNQRSSRRSVCNGLSSAMPRKAALPFRTGAKKVKSAPS
jgi:hypothetical protein